MSRLIDADALRDFLTQDESRLRKEYDKENDDTILAWIQESEFIQNKIQEMPTVDAEPVIRCKDCRWGRERCGNIECSVDLNIPPEFHGYNWFCPNGERGEKK